MVLERNFLDIYKYMAWSDRDIPTYQVGDTFVPSAIDMHEGKTEPPQLLTEAELIALMDKNGIGTDATIAQHIQTIQKRSYAVKHQEQYFAPTTLGLALVAAFENAGLNMTQPHLRAKTEQDLKSICSGAKAKRQIVDENLHEYREIFATLCQNVAKLDEVW
jgi:DNA topoisomerase III